MKLMAIFFSLLALLGLASAAALGPVPEHEAMVEGRQRSQPSKCFYCDNFYKLCLKDHIKNCRDFVCHKRHAQCKDCGYCSKTLAGGFESPVQEPALVEDPAPVQESVPVEEPETLAEPEVVPRQHNQPDPCFFCDGFYKSCLKAKLPDCRGVTCRMKPQCKRCGYCSHSADEDIEEGQEGADN